MFFFIWYVHVYFLVLVLLLVEIAFGGVGAKKKNNVYTRACLFHVYLYLSQWTDKNRLKSSDYLFKCMQISIKYNCSFRNGICLFAISIIDLSIREFVSRNRIWGGGRNIIKPSRKFQNQIQPFIGISSKQGFYIFDENSDFIQTTFWKPLGLKR